MKHQLSQSDVADPERPHKRASTESPVLHCFGMVVNLLFKIEPNYHFQEAPLELSVTKNSLEIVATKSKSIFGHLEPVSRKIIDVLQADLTTVQFFADYVPESSMHSDLGSTTYHNRINKPKMKPAISLCAVLYGPPSFVEAVGQFAERCHIFLQHPRNCQWNVPYRNPHCLTLEHDKTVHTFDIGGSVESRSNLPIAGLYNPIDLFADTTQQEPLASALTPQALCTELYPHQKQALTFMLEREKGWALGSGLRKDIWKKEVDAMSRVAYVNTVSGQKQLKPPVEFRGGLLIDAPGLGKTLSIISLILSTKGSQPLAGEGEVSIPTTLLVVPKTLVQTWKDELARHVKTAEDLKYCIYYGKDKIRHLQELDRYDLLITTYSVVRLDWKLNTVHPYSHPTLHKFKWSRIVLDEAHIIRVPSKSFAKSVCSLRADCRWAVTGTPIQNRLTDLFSLFKFLQCSPFDDAQTFRDHVVQNWKANSDPNSVAKLKTLVNCLSLRRPKSIVKLQPRTDKTIPLRFSEQERQYYAHVQAKLNAVTTEEDTSTELNVLSWVNELRLVCNHGLACRDGSQGLASQSSLKNLWNQAQAQLSFDYLDQLGLARCFNPECSQDLTSSLPGYDEAEHDDEPYIEKSLKILCSSCFQGRCRGEKFFKICNHDNRKSTSSPMHSMQPTLSPSTYTDAESPTKIKRLLTDLLETPTDIKSVVFSGWTRTLDMIQTELRPASIRCLRLDGTLSAERRSNVLRTFRRDPDIRVLLATITCGGLGLDLTVASRAYIMEPQWNPMSEAQALDRIHRIGQKKEVETIRYFIEDSLEKSKVIKLQERKQALADLTIDGDALDKATLTKGRLQYLKELVG